MKRYIVLILFVYLVLLLMPLSVLGVLEPDKPPQSGQTTSPKKTAAPTKSATQTQTTAAAPTQTAPAATGTTASGQQPTTFKILDTKTGQVTEMAEREFLIGTVASEMFPTYHTEALKAQAVASYTYYCSQRAKARANPVEALKGADFSDVPATYPETYTTEGLKARWGDHYDAYYQKITEAVDAVFGKRLLYNGESIFAAYHAIGFGTTEDGKTVWNVDYPYLKSVPSPGDKLSPDYQSVVTFTPEQLSGALKKVFTDLVLPEKVESWIGADPARSAAGTVTKIVIGGKELTGRQVREALDLRSANFTVVYKDGSFRFTVLGYGHGVGMSQYGADYLARQGSNWEEILKYYYTDVAIG